MCGIVALWGNVDRAIVSTMMKRLAHRGPDAEGLYVTNHRALGHRRLSIMDPQGGDQPIWSEDKGCVIVANGEIYNHRALWQDLEERHVCRTASDSETPLHLYEDVLSDVAASLDGMFAFVIADEKGMYAARDPLGIKPLYFTRRGDAWIFGSELKAFDGLVEHVEEFPPGSWYHSETGFSTFWSLPKNDPAIRPVEEYRSRVRSTLESAVTKRLMSDVPVGAFLSGGLDSSLIAALARRHVDQLHTFSVGIQGSADLEAARLVARHLDTIHHEYQFSEEEVQEHLPNIVYSLESFDQDLVRSSVPCHFVSRLASDFVKVILTGEGADELFAGYAYYKDITEEYDVQQELHRSVCALHNINLQRVDRLTMAHSIEGRVPFLDLEMIAVAQEIPPELKLRVRSDGETVEKWILRKVAEDLLPREIVWRQKQQFDEGSGALETLSRGLDRFMPMEDAPAYRRSHSEAFLRSHEEAVYHKLFFEAYENPQSLLPNVARWADRPGQTDQRSSSRRDMEADAESPAKRGRRDGVGKSRR